MTITAKVIAHSRAEDAPDLITLQLRYPRFIHAEFMTHRVFSRNASSSRAIPVERMIQDVIDDPAMPVAWGSNKPGMQAGEEISELVLCGSSLTEVDRYGPYVSPDQAWGYARDRAVEMARNFAKAGYHKQIVNRLLEPFGHISVVVTATDWQNFFDLRCHPDADPTIKALADAMREAIEGSEPAKLEEGQWHLPYVREDEYNMRWDTLRNLSAARCARVSYLNHDGSSPYIEKDLVLAKRLLESKHMSPFEHQATPEPYADAHFGWGNFTTWTQYRKMLE